MDHVGLKEKKYLQLRDVEAYRIAFHLSNYVWDALVVWDFLARNTIGQQFIRAVDSISANIAEGFGRFYKREKIVFYRYSKGSVSESLDWNQKAKVRNLISEEQYTHIFTELNRLPKSINSLIAYTDKKLSV
jgi:four helix bundle protein